MRHFLSCRKGAALAIAAFCIVPSGGASAAPVTGARAAVHAAPAARSISRGTGVAGVRRDGRRFGSVAPGIRRGGSRFAIGSFHGQGYASAPFRYGVLGQRFDRYGLGEGARFGAWSGGFYGADIAPGFAEAYPEPPTSLHPGLPGLPVVLGIEDAPVARPQVTVINGGTGEAGRSLRRSRRNDGPTVNGPGGPAYPTEQAAFAAPRIYRVTVPRG